MRMIRFLRFLFWCILVKPIVWVVLGLNIRGRKNAPQSGPCIIIANHNSHLDTLVLTSLLSWRLLPCIRPVAAADYFLRNRWMSWFSRNIIGIIPVERSGIPNRNPLGAVSERIEKGDIIIIYPEGSRGKPEERQQMKRGISLLAEKHPNVPIVPIFMHGLGKSLPRNEALFVPFICDVFVGTEIHWQGDKKSFMALLEHVFDDLSSQKTFPGWD